mgnify:CR=1 FL=1
MREAERGSLPTSRGLWDVILGNGHPKGGDHERACEAPLQAMVRQDRGDTPYSFRRFLVVDCTGGPGCPTAHDGSHVVACVCVFDSQTQGFANMAAALAEAVEALKESDWTGGAARLDQGWHAAAPVSLVMPVEEEGSDGHASSCESTGATTPSKAPARVASLEAVFTAPDHRRQGLMKMLLRAAIAQCKREHFSCANILVHMKNTAAQRVYMGAGFVKVSQRTHPEFEKLFGDPGFAFLRLQLLDPCSP